MNITQGKQKILKQCRAEMLDRGIIASWFMPKISKEGDFRYYISFSKDKEIVYEFNVFVDDKFNFIEYEIDIR